MCTTTTILRGEASKVAARPGSMVAAVFTAAGTDNLQSLIMNSRCFKAPLLAASAMAFLIAALPEARAAEQTSAITQRTFASPEEATNALGQALSQQDRQAVDQIFGPEVTNILTGDKALDQRHLLTFARRLAEGCTTSAEGADKVILQIGKDQSEFPIPLVKTNGAWMFDTVAGAEEIINRHIGRDEYYAIGVCRAYVKAQHEYAERLGGGSPVYAERLKSSPGKTDGLYWPPESSAVQSPFASFLAEASTEGYHWGRGKGAHPFHGYFFKILTRQGSSAPGGKMSYIRDGKMTGGFALVAYPIRFGESGIMTFIVNQDGTVYQRCLGEGTERRAAAMKEDNPDSQWTVVKELGLSDLNPDPPVEGAR